MIHPDRKFAFLVFALMCAASAAFLWVAIKYPHFVTFGLFCAFLGIAGFGGYRAFCLSDDWHRERADRHQLWIEAHPRLWTIIFYLTILAFVALMVINLTRYFGGKR